MVIFHYFNRVELHNVLSFFPTHLLGPNAAITDSVYRRIETQNNPSNLNVDSVMGRIQNTESETRNTNNQLSILESAVEMSSFTSSFHPYSVGELTSFPPEVRSHPTVGRSPLYPGNHPHMPSPANSPCSLTPQLISSNPSLGFYNPLQANSTNQNQVVSQPQFLSNWLSSSLAPTNSRTDRKVALKNMPPSVSRTP